MDEAAVAERPRAQQVSGDLAPGRAPQRTGRMALAVFAGLAIGLVAAVVGPRLLDGGGDGATQVGDVGAARTLGDERADAARGAEDDGPAPAGAGAPSAEAAVTGFLDAEVAGDFETSFGYLSAQDRRQYLSPAGWVGRHADVLAPVTGYELIEVREAADVAEVVTDVRFTPGLNQVTGFTPAAARVTWLVAGAPDGTWGVELDASTIEPILPPDDGAAAAARTWVDARRACEQPENERGALVGSPALADRLCDVAEPSLGEVEALSSADAQPVFNAFGPSATAAARLVRVSAPVELGVVLLPLGETWTVIAVVP